MIVIVDSGGANLLSIKGAIARLGKPVMISGQLADIQQASHLILPGVGSAQTVMDRLTTLGLVDVLQTTPTPVLGICVGMQILFAASDESTTPCLGIVPGRVTKLPFSVGCCLPHMGWNTINSCVPSTLLQGIAQPAYVYYTHSFAALTSSHAIALSHYGTSFCAAIQYRNVMGVQFHPERSGAVGRQLLTNFLEQTA